jgi:parallel beta-helix repeat protein
MKETAAALILMCLMALNLVCVPPVKAQYRGDITINADGSVTPSSAPIQQKGDTYTLTSDVEGSIVVERNNTVLDGNEHIVAEISLIHMSNVIVKNFVLSIPTIVDSRFGFYAITIRDSSKVTIINNTITGIWGIYELMGYFYAGIFVEGGGSNTIIKNNLVNNDYGIYLSGTKSNLIVENNIIDNETQAGFSTCGIKFNEASNNTIYHNNFMNKIDYNGQVSVYNSSNVWDGGYPGGGNYWVDYHKKYPGATEVDGSGIGDTPYVLDAQNVDRYPLMEAFNSTFFELQVAPPKISIQSPKKQAYNESSVPLDFSVVVVSSVKVVSWMGYSLDGQQNVTVTGNVTLAALSSGLHSVTVYGNDTYGNMGASEAVAFTIQEPFPVATVVVVSGVLIALVVGAGIVLYCKRRRRKQLFS